jgi:hypothetical protein
LPLLAGALHDRYGSLTYAYYTAAGILVLAAVVVQRDVLNPSSLSANMGRLPFGVYPSGGQIGDIG